MFASWVELLNAKSADETKGTPKAVQSGSQLGVFVEWSAGVTAGVLVIEMARLKDYAGKWAEIMRFDFAAGSVANGTDYQTQPGPFGFVRARIEEAIQGGTVSAYGQTIEGRD